MAIAKKQSVIFRGRQQQNASKSLLPEYRDRIDQRTSLQDTGKRKKSQGLENLALGSEQVILDIKAVFPFDFFPDELIIDETKVSIHTNFFFFSKEVRSIEYSDIFNVIIQQGLFFAKIEIVDRYFSQQSIIVDYLMKKDAILARRIIQGMVIAQKENIDFSRLSREDILQKLERIGMTR